MLNVDECEVRVNKVLPTHRPNKNYCFEVTILLIYQQIMLRQMCSWLFSLVVRGSVHT